MGVTRAWNPAPCERGGVTSETLADLVIRKPEARHCTRREVSTCWPGQLGGERESMLHAPHHPGPRVGMNSRAPCCPEELAGSREDGQAHRTHPQSAEGKEGPCLQEDCGRCALGGVTSLSLVGTGQPWAAEGEGDPGLSAPCHPRKKGLAHAGPDHHFPRCERPEPAASH